MDICPCGNGKPIQNCCMPYIKKEVFPESAENLMRARYSAYTLCNIDFIYDTHAPSTRGLISKDDIRNWAKSSKWIGLKVLSVKKGKSSDTDGIVEFKAHYINNGKKQTHHETSKFIKIDGMWYYEGWVEETRKKKIGRNSPCPCGSGKKYKTCCGK